MKLNFTILDFKDLTTMQLFLIGKFRQQVFVVEQNCPYQDFDDIDLESKHVILWVDEHFGGYCRIYSYHNIVAHIGRVMITKPFRNKELAYNLMDKAHSYLISEHKNVKWIKISAQNHLTNFYKNLGYYTTSDMYLEDNIPHIEMIRNINRY